MMDQNQHSHVIAQFRLKYSRELADSGKFRRKFSSQFKIELLQALEASQLTQREFSEAIGISLSVISKCRKHFEFKTPSDHNVNEHSFHQIKIENPISHNRSGLYLQSLSGVKVYGLSISQISDLLRTL